MSLHKSGMKTQASSSFAMDLDHVRRRFAYAGIHVNSSFVAGLTEPEDEIFASLCTDEIGVTNELTMLCSSLGQTPTKSTMQNYLNTEQSKSRDHAAAEQLNFRYNSSSDVLSNATEVSRNSTVIPSKDTSRVNLTSAGDSAHVVSKLNDKRNNSSVETLNANHIQNEKMDVAYHSLQTSDTAKLDKDTLNHTKAVDSVKYSNENSVVHHAYEDPKPSEHRITSIEPKNARYNSQSDKIQASDAFQMNTTSSPSQRNHLTSKALLSQVVSNASTTTPMSTDASDVQTDANTSMIQKNANVSNANTSTVPKKANVSSANTSMIQKNASVSNANASMIPESATTDGNNASISHHAKNTSISHHATNTSMSQHATNTSMSQHNTDASISQDRSNTSILQKNSNLNSPVKTKPVPRTRECRSASTPNRKQMHRFLGEEQYFAPSSSSSFRWATASRSTRKNVMESCLPRMPRARPLTTLVHGSSPLLSTLKYDPFKQEKVTEDHSKQDSSSLYDSFMQQKKVTEDHFMKQKKVTEDYSMRQKKVTEDYSMRQDSKEATEQSFKLPSFALPAAVQLDPVDRMFHHDMLLSPSMGSASLKEFQQQVAEFVTAARNSKGKRYENDSESIEEDAEFDAQLEAFRQRLEAGSCVTSHKENEKEQQMNHPPSISSVEGHEYIHDTECSTEKVGDRSGMSESFCMENHSPKIPPAVVRRCLWRAGGSWSFDDSEVLSETNSGSDSCHSESPYKQRPIDIFAQPLTQVSSTSVRKNRRRRRTEERSSITTRTSPVARAAKKYSSGKVQDGHSLETREGLSSSIPFNTKTSPFHSGLSLDTLGQNGDTSSLILTSLATQPDSNLVSNILPSIEQTFSNTTQTSRGTVRNRQKPVDYACSIDETDSTDTSTESMSGYVSDTEDADAEPSVRETS